MTITLRAIHACPQQRADVRLRQHACAQKSDELRDEIEETRPLLRWPVKQAAKVAA